MRPAPRAPSRAARVARAVRAATLVASLTALLTLGVACSSCPPAWVERVPESPGWLYASGSCAPVFVDADATAMALTRAARHLTDALGLDVEPRLSVRQLDGRLFVEAVTPDGPVDALDELELVELVECEGTVHALLRLPRGGEAEAEAEAEAGSDGERGGR